MRGHVHIGTSPSAHASARHPLDKQRNIVGDEPSEDMLLSLLRRHNDDIEAAANAYFDGQAAPTSSPLQGQQVSGLVQVTVPVGVVGGQEIQVSTDDAAPFRVTVPAGLVEGDDFLARPPSTQRRGAVPVARPIGQSPAHSDYPGLSTLPPQPAQPPLVVVQQPPPVPRCRGRPCCYGRPYYYDPLMPMMGFMGGMLIADALFW